MWLSLFTFALGAPAVNGTVPADATPSGMPSAADDGKSPWQRYVAGALFSGVYSVHDAKACSVSGARALDPKVMAPGGTVLDNDHDALLTNWVNAIGSWHGRFAQAGDMVVLARHTCVGVLDTGVPNATSYFQGYMLFDPRAMALATRGPGLQFGRVEAVLAHEYAHQLQYWHGSVFTGERSDRRIELAADCMAGAILATEGAQQSGGGKVTMLAIESGVSGAFKGMGDNDVLGKGHHGTPEERDRFARAGVRIGLDHYNAGGERWALHSGTLKALCEDVVMKSDANALLRHPSDLLEPGP